MHRAGAVALEEVLQAGTDDVVALQQQQGAGGVGGDDVAGEGRPLEHRAGQRREGPHRRHARDVGAGEQVGHDDVVDAAGRAEVAQPAVAGHREEVRQQRGLPAAQELPAGRVPAIDDSGGVEGREVLLLQRPDGGLEGAMEVGDEPVPATPAVEQAQAHAQASPR